MRLLRLVALCPRATSLRTLGEPSSLHLQSAVIAQLGRVTVWDEETIRSHMRDAAWSSVRGGRSYAGVWRPSQIDGGMRPSAIRVSATCRESPADVIERAEDHAGHLGGKRRRWPRLGASLQVPVFVVLAVTPAARRTLRACPLRRRPRPVRHTNGYGRGASPARSWIETVRVGVGYRWPDPARSTAMIGLSELPRQVAPALLSCTPNGFTAMVIAGKPFTLSGGRQA